MPRPTSCWVLNILKDGDSTISLSNLFQYWITLKVKHWLSVFRWNFLVYNLCPLLLLLSVSSAEKCLAHSFSFLPIRYAFTSLRSPLNLLFSRLKSLLEGWSLLSWNSGLWSFFTSWFLLSGPWTPPSHGPCSQDCLWLISMTKWGGVSKGRELRVPARTIWVSSGSPTACSRFRELCSCSHTTRMVEAQGQHTHRRQHPM